MRLLEDEIIVQVVSLGNPAEENIPCCESREWCRKILVFVGDETTGIRTHPVRYAQQDDWGKDIYT